MQPSERRNPLARRQDEEIALAGDGNGQKELPISLIRRDGQTQPRDGMSEDVVTDYVAALADGVQFPPVDVMFDGTHYWLFDGFHRVETYLRSGRTAISARCYDGTLEDAQWRSYAANKSHGLRRSTADKERSIRLALKHPKAPGLSNEQMAKHLGVDPKTVAKYRAEMVAALEIPELKARVGADGKTYDTTNIGKRSLASRVQRLVNDDWGFSSKGASPQRGLHHRSYTGSAYIEFDTELAAVEFAEQAMREKPLATVTQLVGAIIEWLDRSIGGGDGLDTLKRARGPAVSDERRNLEWYLDGAGVAWKRSDVDLALTHLLNQNAVATMTHAALSAPRPLSLDETIAVIWRLIKHNCAGDQRAETLHGIVTKHTKMTDYKHLLTSEVVFSFDTFSEAWTRVANELLGRIVHAERKVQKAQPTQPTQQPAVDEATTDSEAPPADLDALPADLVERGWVLKQMVASGRWWCHNTNGPRATSAYDTIADAIQEAWGMQVDVAKPPVKPAATDEVAMALQRIELAIGELVERLGLDMLRVRLDERQGNPWSLLASKGDNELNWSHGNIVGVSSALVNLGRKGAR